MWFSLIRKSNQIYGFKIWHDFQKILVRPNNKQEFDNYKIEFWTVKKWVVNLVVDDSVKGC